MWSHGGRRPRAQGAAVGDPRPGGGRGGDRGDPPRTAGGPDRSRRAGGPNRGGARGRVADPRLRRAAARAPPRGAPPRDPHDRGAAGRGPRTVTRYVDTSALVKRYVDEPEAAAARRLLLADTTWVTATHTIVEVYRTLHRRLDGTELGVALDDFRLD